MQQKNERTLPVRYLQENTYKDRWRIPFSILLPKHHFAEKYLSSSLLHFSTICILLRKCWICIITLSYLYSETTIIAIYKKKKIQGQNFNLAQFVENIFRWLSNSGSIVFPENVFNCKHFMSKQTALARKTQCTI